MFANFRSVKATGIGENTLYRSASPCDNQHNRAPYVDALIKAAGIKCSLNLSDNEEKLQGYIAAGDFNSPYFLSLYENGNVLPPALNMNYGSEEFRKKVAAGLIELRQHEGPCLVHCTEGKDHAGFVCVLTKAGECGVVLLSENILWGESSDPGNIADPVEKVDSDRFGRYFDVGHARCCGYAPDVPKECSVTPMSLHIQDNDGSGNRHLIPGDGTIDWNVFTKTLQEIGYLGDCVMEAHHQGPEESDEERDAILTRLLETAQTIRDQMC